MKRSYLLSLLQAGMLAYAQEPDATSAVDTVDPVTFTVVPVESTSIPDAYAGIFFTDSGLSPVLTVSPVATTMNEVGDYGTVTVTSTRTFVDYCGCGIPGVSTIIGPTLISTSSTTSSTSSTSSTSDTTSTSTSTQTQTTGGQILPPATVTTSITTTTTSAGNTIDAGLTGTTTSSSTSSSSTTSSSTSSTVTTTTSTSSTSTSTSTTSTSTATTSTSTTSTSSTSTSTTSTSTSSTTTTSPTTTTTTTSSSTTTTTSSSTTTTTATTTTTTAGAVVTDQAYIDTVLRHHNVHRNNHTAPLASWSPSLAETARQIASSCNYGHNVTANGGGYGQNIGAGFPSTSMGAFITEGLYNSEVNSYTYYGGEPDTSTVGQWGHFTQVVWKASTNVGCYTQDCTATGLANAPGIPPYFTVCNYQAAGNVVGSFNANVGTPLGHPTVFADYGCPSRVNCAGTTQ